MFCVHQCQWVRPHMWWRKRILHRGIWVKYWMMNHFTEDGGKNNDGKLKKHVFSIFCQELSHFLCYIFPLVLLSRRKYSNFRRVFHQVSRLIGNCLQLTAFIPPGYSVFIGTQLINISRLPSIWLSPCNFGPNLKLSILFSDNFWHFTNQTFGQSYNFPSDWSPDTILRQRRKASHPTLRSPGPDCGALNKQLSPRIAGDCPRPSLPPRAQDAHSKGRRNNSPATFTFTIKFC